MPTLFLLRHAKSSWDEPGLTDHERPLARRGVRDAKRIARHLARTGLEPEVVLCSTAVRTRETLELVERALGEPVVEYRDELYAAPAGSLLEQVHALADGVGSAMLIGHNPGLQELALLLAGTGDELERLRGKYPTAALATLTFETTWQELSPGDAELAAYVVPKDLEG